MDRSETTLSERPVDNAVRMGGRASILGQGLARPNPCRCRCGSRKSVSSSCYWRHAGGENIGARSATWFPLSYAGYMRERGLG